MCLIANKKAKAQPFQNIYHTAEPGDWTIKQNVQWEEDSNLPMLSRSWVIELSGSSWQKCIFKNLCNVPSHTEEQRRPHSSQTPTSPAARFYAFIAARSLLFKYYHCSKFWKLCISLGCSKLGFHACEILSFYLNKYFVANLSFGKIWRSFCIISERVLTTNGNKYF